MIVFSRTQTRIYLVPNGTKNYVTNQIKFDRTRKNAFLGVCDELKSRSHLVFQEHKSDWNKLIYFLIK